MSGTGRLTARLEVLAAAFLFSTGGAAVKAVSLTGWQTASLRSGVAAVALLALVPQARRRWTWSVGLVSLAYAGTLSLFVLANKLTTAANAIFLQSTGPLYLLFLGPLILHEPARRRDLIPLSVMALGLLCFFLGDQSPQRTAPNPWAGNILGALSGLTWALTLAGLRWFGKQGSGSTAAVAAGNVIAFCCCLPGAISTQFAPTVTDLAIIAYLGVFQIGLAYWMLTRAVTRLPALETSMLVLLEPALNPLWTWLVHGEQVGPLAMAGGLAILGATAGMVLAGARK